MATLFLKYRPQTFGDLVGQELVIKTLRNALKNEKPSHAYLFSGSRGTGKTSTARIFAKGLNCLDLDNGSPCGKCNICETTANGSLVDVIEIDAASNRGIDEIRALRERVNFTPNIAKRKIYIIDEVHMLTKEAFNALLKTLEEPPDHAFFCLATTEMHKIPETIVSRCQSFIFQRFPIEQLVDRLEHISKSENIKAERTALELIAKKAEGGMRDAISLLEQMAAETDGDIKEDTVRDSLGISSTEILENFWDAIYNNQSESGFEILKNISQKGGDFRTFGHDFLSFLRQKLHDNLNNNEVLEKVLLAIEEVQKAISRLKTSPIIELPFEIAVVNLTTDIQTTIVPASRPAPAAKSVSQNAVKSAPIQQEVSSQSAPPPPAPPEENSGFVFEKPLSPDQKTSAPVVETPKPAAPVAVDSNFSVESVKSQMAVIAEKAGIPIFVKKSFMTAVPRIEGNDINFNVASSFHLEKLSESSTQNSIQKALSDIYGQSIVIRFIGQQKTAPAPVAKSPQEEVATVDDLLDF